MSRYSYEEIKDILINTLKEETDCEIKHIDGNTNLIEDLEFDSLGIVDYIFKVENNLNIGIDIDTEDIDNIKNINELAEYI